MRILVLEDDQFICEQIKTYFELNDHEVELYNDGDSLLNNAILQNFDIFLFDINTPKKNGFETLKIIREENIDTPAMFLTALSDIDSVKQGYDIGCNDYVRKPFSLEEVELRIMQLIYKNNKQLVEVDNNYSFDCSKMNLYKDNVLVELSTIQKNLIYILIKNIGQIVPSDIIIDYVWNEKDVCKNTLRTQIKKLRLKLDNNFIINIRNSGYKIEKYDSNR